jgi:hypothetical protein
MKDELSEKVMNQPLLRALSSPFEAWRALYGLLVCFNVALWWKGADSAGISGYLVVQRNRR